MNVKTATTNSYLAARRATAIVAPMPHFLPSITVLFFSTLLLHPAPLLATETNSAESPSAIVNECKRIGNKLGSVSTRECLAHQLQESGGTSVTGQAIMIKEYPPLAAREPKARILLIGGTHGDEYSSVSIIFKWMKTLDTHHSGLFHWHVSPLVNPDGLLQRPSQRLNANGVDLNRNMPSPDWYKSTSAYWEKTGFDKRRYPGTAPLSEPESRWLYEEIRAFKPHAIVSVHAPYGVLDFDGPPVGPNQLGQLHLHLIGTYPGSLGNSAGVQHQIPVITVELPYAGIMPSEDEISRMWTDLIRWLRLNVPKEKTNRAYATFDETSKQLMASPAADTAQQTKAPAEAVNAAATEAEKSSDIHMNSRIDN